MKTIPLSIAVHLLCAVSCLASCNIDPRDYGLVVGDSVPSAVRKANRTALEDAVAAAVASGGRKVMLPAGDIEIEYADGESIAITGSVWIDGQGKGATQLDVYPKAVSFPFDGFEVTTTGDHRIKVSNFSADGPTSGDGNLDNTDFFQWSKGGTQGSIFDVENIEITGLFASGVFRSGGGILRVRGCDINAWEAPLKFYESNDVSGEPENAHLQLSDSTLTGTDGKNTSIGIYIHPHCCFQISNTLFRDFARFGVYQNGSPANRAKFAAIDNCAFIDTRGLQTMSHVQVANSTFRGAGRDGNTAMMINYNVSFANCVLEDIGVNSTSDAAKTIQLNGCTLEQSAAAYTAVVSGSGADVLRYVGCEWVISGNGRCISTSTSWPNGRLYIDNCVIDHQESNPAPPTLFLLRHGEVWIDGLRCRNAKVTGIYADGDSSVLHLKNIDWHADTPAWFLKTSGAANQTHGEGLFFRGSVYGVINDAGATQQRLVRGRGVNPDTIAAAATINTNVPAWVNYDTHVITGSTDIATLDNPWIATGEVKLIAAAGATWALLDTGNIAPLSPGTPKSENDVVTLVWEPTAGKWLEK